MASLATSLVGPRTSWLVTSRLSLLHGPARHAHGDAKAETQQAPSLPIYPGLTRSFSIWPSRNACFNRPGAEIRLDFRNNLLSSSSSCLGPGLMTHQPQSKAKAGLSIFIRLFLIAPSTLFHHATLPAFYWLPCLGFNCLLPPILETFISRMRAYSLLRCSF